MNRADLNKKILIDSDIIRHFIKGRNLNALSQIFPDNLYILDVVEAEICRSKKIKPIVQELINTNALKRMNFPTRKKRIREEYCRLQLKSIGNGESACMAVARYTKDIIASNNRKDINDYCIENEILYLTTLDMLCVAFQKGVMTISDIDYFLYLNKHDIVPSKIPYETYDDYIQTKPAILSFIESIC